jgi:hypothetical protein
MDPIPVSPHLTAETFPVCYRRLKALRFPMNVAEVLELRALLNQAIENFPSAENTPDMRDFREMRLSEMDRREINRPHHREKLLALLTLVRELHYQHSTASRDSEVAVRVRLSQNEESLLRTRRYAYAALGLMVTLLGLTFLFEPLNLAGKIAATIAGWFAFEFFHSLPTFNQEEADLHAQLNEVLRNRVAAVDWKTLVHHLSLVLGFQQQEHGAVFRMESEYADTVPPWRTH